MTDGYQKWHGNLPNFNISEIIKNGIARFHITESGHHIKNLLVINRADPSACDRKYLIAPSHSWFVFECRITGIKLIKFNSKAAQTNSQFELDMAIIVLITMVNNLIIIKGDWM
jgi:hypothetical protein